MDGAEPKHDEQATDILERAAAPEHKGLNIAVLLPAFGTMCSSTAVDLAVMMGFLGAGPVAAGLFERVSLSMKIDTYVHSARQTLIEQAISDGADYMLWLDSDMRFPMNVLLRLMNHKKDVVGINYSTRGMPPDFVTIKKMGKDNLKDPGGKPCITGSDSTGLEKVDAIGFGAVLIRTGALKRLPDPKKHPWFWFENMPKTGRMIGEDVYFCRMLRRSGVSIYVDHDLSKECAHIGTFEFRCEHAASFNADMNDMMEVLTDAGD